VKLEGGRPWGFKIAGGAEVNKPILITKVHILSRLSILTRVYKQRPILVAVL
jgi:hypothetical protein